jgi:hypothetical protein
VVNSGDQLLLAKELLRILAGATPLRQMDLNLDGRSNPGDQLARAWVIMAVGLCG